VTNKDILRLKLVPRTQVEEMAEMLAVQGRRLRELEAKLQREKLEKANLEIDFQHLLDHLRGVSHCSLVPAEQAMVCG
jgi:hypothetical protein